MSKNVEVLHRAQREHEIFTALHPATTNGNRKHARLDLDAMARDQIIKLVERLFLSAGENTAQHTVMFSSVDAGDKSSAICASASKTLAARVRGSVCVVDANLYSPSLHEQFGADNVYGFEDMISQSAPVRTFARQLSAGNLWLVMAGKRSADSSTLLASERLRTRLIELRQEFDYVLIDAPSVSINGTATLFGPYADGIVLVVEAHSTRREVLRNARENLERANLRLFGAVLNNRTFPIPETIYRSL